MKFEMILPQNEPIIDRDVVDGVVNLEKVYNASIFASKGYFNDVSVQNIDRVPHVKKAPIYDHDHNEIQPNKNNNTSEYDTSWVGVQEYLGITL